MKILVHRFKVQRLIDYSNKHNEINRMDEKSRKRLTLNPEPGTLNPDRLDVQFSCNPATAKESQLFFQAE